jgi:hypothetical protein
MNRKIYTIIVFVTIFMVSCDSNKPFIDTRLKLYTASNKVVIFESDPLTKIIVDPNGGLVLPLSLKDQKNIRKATASPNYLKQNVEFYIGGRQLYTLNLYPDNETKFFYLRGNFNKTINLLKGSGVTVISVDEVPTDSANIHKLLATKSE